MTTAELARDRLVRRLRATGRIRTPRVEQAFRSVPRHLFLPEASVDDAYSDHAVAIKWRDGTAISSASQPSMMAIMLEQLDIRPGHRVLEIGAGTGYNAALIAFLVGAQGVVAAVDIDCDLVESAARHLAAADVTGVRLACRDGALGYQEAGPYDRIVLTVGSWDILPSWLDQLDRGGRLLLPLSVQGSQLSIALDVVDDPAPHLQSTSVRSCAFIRMRGASARLGPDPWGGAEGLSVQGSEGRVIDVAAVRDALRDPRPERLVRTSLVGADLWDGLGLWLAINEPDAFRLLVSGDSAASEDAPSLLTGTADAGTMALLGEDGFAALVRADQGGPTSRPFRVAVRPYGPGGEPATERLLSRLDDWVRRGRPASDALRVRAYRRSGAPDPPAGTIVIDKEHSRLFLDWRDRAG
jgi:protein-L-isoaspartate(D-aspartate) O-methyltransferase